MCHRRFGGGIATSYDGGLPTTGDAMRLQLNSMRSLTALALATSAVLPVLLLLSVGVFSNAAERSRVLDTQLQQATRLAAVNVEALVAEHRAVLSTVASIPALVEQFDETRVHPWLSLLRGPHTRFVSAAAARSDGALLAVNPEVNADGVRAFWRGTNIADRDYLYVAVQTRSSYVSAAFRGRSVDTKPILALSSPVIDRSTSEVLGILQGALLLESLHGAAAQALGERDDFELLLIDRTGATVGASAAYGLQPLDNAISHPAVAAAIAAGSNITFRWSVSAVSSYRGHGLSSEDGWTIIASASDAMLVDARRSDLIRATVTVLIVFAAVLLLAPWLARLITRPLHDLVRMMDGFDGQAAQTGSATETRMSRLVELRRVQQSFLSLAQRHAESTVQLQTSLDRQTELFERLEQVVAQQEQAIERRTAELQTALAALKDESLTDSMTGLANYRRYWRELPRIWEQCLRETEAFGIVTLDIDYFKPYNDTYGHQAGDDCLRRVSASFRDTFRDRAELVARSGGEEFIVVLRGKTPHAARNLAERARHAVRALEIPHKSSSVDTVVTISLGVCVCRPTPSLNPEAVVKKADEMLYDAKRLGRNQVALTELKAD